MVVKPAPAYNVAVLQALLRRTSGENQHHKYVAQTCPLWESTAESAARLQILRTCQASIIAFLLPLD